MARIEDVIVKTILCAEMSVGTACRMFMPHKNCCFGKQIYACTSAYLSILTIYSIHNCTKLYYPMARAATLLCNLIG